MRNQTVILLFVFMLVSSVFGGVYSGGAGEPNEPFIIASANDLQQIAYEPNDLDKCFKMVADVNLAELGRNFDVIGSDDWYTCFSGVFDGDGHTISNFKCDVCDVIGSSFGGVGVFYFIRGETAEVKNLGIINADVNSLSGYVRIGTLAGGVGEGAKVTNCYAENCSVKNGREVGGLVGVSDEGVLSNCYTTWNVTASDHAGGLVAIIENDSIIEDCYTTGDITGTGTVGGLVAVLGEHSSFLIEDCYTTGDVTGVGVGDYDCVGGLVGYMSGYGYPDKPNAIQRCYSTGKVSGCPNVGGLIGMMDSSNLKIVDSYATGDVNVFYINNDTVDGHSDNFYYDFDSVCAGGLIGLIGEYGGHDIEIINCHAAGDVDLPLFYQYHEEGEYAGGLIGAIIVGDRIIVKDCSATGDVSLTGNSEDLSENETYGGGLVGYCNWAEVASCYATGDVEGFDYVGGLVGWHQQACRDCTITNCYAMGDVNGVDYVGGFAGYAVGEIYDSYSSGEVNGGVDVNSVGGFVGLYECGYHGEIIDDCFWDVESSGMLIGVGFVDGELSEPLDVQGKTTAQMKSRGTFVDADWDFINIWGIGENQTYPYLRQYSAADINADSVVNFADFAILADRWLE